MKVYLVVFLCTLSFKSGLSQPVFAYGLSENDQKIVLDIHNDYRKAIANGSLVNVGLPRGINLKKLKYDVKLAYAAQAIANTTNFDHVTVRDDRWHSVGQNLYLSSSTAHKATADWNAAVTSWFNEYTKYTYGACCLSGTGHFTQVIWADTEYVGCGYLYYMEYYGFPYQKLYVCNYGPAGNYIGTYPYQNGTSGCENLCD